METAGALTLAPGLSWWREMQKEPLQRWVAFPIKEQAVELFF